MKKAFSLILFVFFILNADETDLKDVKKSNLPTIAIITTGGTIGEISDPQTGASIPGKGDFLLKATPQINKIANIKHIEFSNIDSSQMTPEIWADLCKKTDEVLNDKNIVGAVITHGTDTMAEGSFFLNLTLKSKKPVVFTGAMRNASDPNSDGPFNLYNAVVQVLSKNAKTWGVTVTLNQYINSANYVVKTNTTNPQTFSSGEKGYLGYIYKDEVYRLNNMLYSIKFPIPEKFPNIYIFQDYAGAKGDIIKYITDLGADGIIIEGLGSGNVNDEVYKSILYALSKNVIIIITSTVPHGGVFPIYGDEGGGKELLKAGAIFSKFLRADKARILLILALPYVGKDKEKLAKYFSIP